MAREKKRTGKVVHPQAKKKVKVSKKPKYVSLFSRKVSKPDKDYSQKQLNRIKRSIEGNSAYMKQEKRSFTEQHSPKKERFDIYNTSMMPLIESSTSFINDEIVMYFLAMLHDELHDFNKNTMIATSTYFVPRYLNINITSDTSSIIATTDFEYVQNDEDNNKTFLIHRLPYQISVFLGLKKTTTYHLFGSSCNQ